VEVEEFPSVRAVDIARAIRSREVRAVDVLEILLSRIESLNPPLNAIVTLDVAGARERAQSADEALRRGEVWGPLHGVPITVKDSFETAGVRTVSGHLAFAHHLPQVDAVAVARLRQSGGILLGKTNVPELARGIQTDNPVFGRTNNPWDLGRTPGGSSGGAAAAVAAALTYLDLGSDIGGSIRIPAHFCGVYGLKTTARRVSGRGHLASPRPPAIPSDMRPLVELASVGPIARSIEDLRLALSILAEPNTPALEPPRARRAGELRLAWGEDFGGTPLDADSHEQMQTLAEKLVEAGVVIDRGTPPFDFDEAWYIAGVCLGSVDTLLQSATRRWLRRWGAPVLGLLGRSPSLKRGLIAGASLRPNVVRDALARREKLIERLERFLDERDAWICPVFPTPAFTHRGVDEPIEVDGRSVSQLMANLSHSLIFNVTGHPVVTLPIGLSSEGLPIGVQVVGRRWQETALLDVAEPIAKLAGGFRSPPD
jgi:amidase